MGAEITAVTPTEFQTWCSAHLKWERGGVRLYRFIKESELPSVGEMETGSIMSLKRLESVNPNNLAKNASESVQEY